MDSCIALLIIQLNMVGIETSSSCCGHGNDYPYVVCEQGTERKLREFGCANVRAGHDGLVRADFRVLSLSGKVYMGKNKKSGKNNE